MKVGTIVTVTTVLLITFVGLRHLTPPTTLTLAAGPVGGAYQAFARRYQQALSKYSVQLRIVETSGAVENMALLSRTVPGADAGLVQGGLAGGANLDRIKSLGRFFYEPIWIFHSLASYEHRLASFVGKRIAIGATGSGTHVLATKLLAENGITASNSVLVELDFNQTAAALAAGEVDAGILVASPEAPAIRALLGRLDVRPAALANANANIRRLPFLAAIELPRGAVDLRKEIPSANIPLLATTGALLVREDLHPALVSLLTEVASRVHATPGLFEKSGEFPQQTDPEFEMADAAVRYHRHGTPFFHRHLSFWMADLAERSLLVGLPALAILLPTARGLRRLYQSAVRWRMRRWYTALRCLDAECSRPLDTLQAARLHDELDDLAEDILTAPVPLEFNSDMEALARMVDKVRSKLEANLAARAAR